METALKKYAPFRWFRPDMQPLPLVDRCLMLSRGAAKAWYRLTHWETWYYITKYIPLAPVWLWYCLRARSCWFFTPSNPTLTFGGFEGESKKEMYDQMRKSVIQLGKSGICDQNEKNQLNGEKVHLTRNPVNVPERNN